MWELRTSPGVPPTQAVTTHSPSVPGPALNTWHSMVHMTFATLR